MQYPPDRSRSLLNVGLMIISAVLVVIVVIQFLDQRASDDESPNNEEVASGATHTPTFTATYTPTATHTVTPTLDIVNLVETLDVKATAELETAIAHETARARATAYALGTQERRDTTRTAAAWTDTPTLTATSTSTFTPTSTPTVTPTPTASFTPTPSPTPDPAFKLALERAAVPVESNADWVPYVWNFDGVDMVLVPAGCFEMGSNVGNADEQPVHTICFDTPFWIDRYEITNGLYGSAGCGSEVGAPDNPRGCLNWADAGDFCESRGMRLPTEAEWEYAARGPDNLIYPWGNDFNSANVIYDGINVPGLSVVGSRPAGASWVGALDMSGNLWEWTSSRNAPYPYVDDVRHEGEWRRGDLRILRGGAYNSYADEVNASNRNASSTLARYDSGARCVRSQP